MGYKYKQVRVGKSLYSDQFKGCSTCIHGRTTNDSCKVRNCIHAFEEFDDCYIPMEDDEGECDDA